MRGVGPTDWRHTKQARKAKKRPQAWRAWGRRDCRRAGLSSPPAPRLCWHDRPSARGEHSAGPAPTGKLWTVLHRLFQEGLNLAGEGETIFHFTIVDLAMLTVVQNRNRQPGLGRNTCRCFCFK
jgi:hypothetical protein